MFKKYSELTFTDDFMFCKILENNERLTIRIVELILGKKVRSIHNLKAQREMSDYSDSRGIRFDVYFEDDDENIYDIEMQTYNEGNLMMRSRYYHSIIAVDNLNKNVGYEDMKYSYVIFICTFDPFKLGLPVYTAVTKFIENPDYEVSDGVMTKFLNCTCDPGKLSPELKSFFKYVTIKLPSDGLTNTIENDLLKAKSKQEWRWTYMTLWELEQRMKKETRVEALAEGRAEGRAEERAHTIDALMKNLDLSVEAACKAVNITLEEYKAAKRAMYPDNIKSEGDSMLSESHI